MPLLHQPKKQLALATDSNLQSATRSMLELFPKCSGLPHVPLLKRPSTLMLPLPPSENKSLREERAVGTERVKKKRDKVRHRGKREEGESDDKREKVK